ncbi:TetR/AcrR family transcriptional regulator [Kiloniella antarctica]|uniref:TetR/AcrR family transcriptional regulator n=1 Tax=Kiloniella antarctica TaxID=1550907 RepID=A0ABW5BKC3_9PROT
MGRGRPRKMDPETVLETAMKVFWNKGFDGTSMTDLVNETGMAKPGLYACFGDKESLYKKALSHYNNSFGSPAIDELRNSNDPLKVRVRNFLNNVAHSMLDKNNPSGCFVVNSLVQGASQHTEMEAIGQKYDQNRRSAFIEIFEKSQQKGELPPEVDAKALAEFFSAQSLALGVLGRANASRETITSIVDIALTVLPE